MSTSGSTSFAMTRDEIITDALLNIGAIGIDDTPSASEVTIAARELNRMIKAWEADGIHVWTRTEMSLPLVEEQATYTLSPTPLYIESARFRNADGIDRPVYIDSRTVFMQISDKTTPGKISRIYYDAQLNSGTLYVWPVPDDDTETLQITYARKIEDFDAAGDNPDLPQEWLDAVVSNLAVRLAPKYGATLANKRLPSELLQQAQESLAILRMWDSETAKIRIVPAQDYYNA